MKAPLPVNESTRVAALHDYGVFNLTPEAGLDHLVQLAARLLRAPHCFITLLDSDTQLIKSCFGDLGAKRMDRDIAFCSYTILNDTVMVVENALKDTRFAANPLVTGPLGVRFYAGAPLRTAGGFNLGAFCVIDTVPRQFGADEQATLSSFAAVASEILDAKLVNRRLQIETAEREQADARSEVTDSLLRTIINETEDAVFIKDLEGRYLLINPAGAKFLGRSNDEIIGRRDDEFFSPETARSTHETDAMVLESGHSHTYEDDGTVDGVQRTFLSTKNPYRDETGRIIGVIGIARDITERRVAGQALETAKNDAEKANRAKSDFLSRMSHELRTPLNAILGFGQLLELGALEPREQESVEHILEGGRHLLGLIDEVLEISRIEVGKLRLSLEPVHVMEVASECQTLIERLASTRGVKFRVECEEDCWVWADRQRIKQVILNFLSNAVKYNRENGSASLICRRQVADCHLFEGNECRSLRIEVSDTGMGLTPGEIARLFVPFERLTAENGSMEGTGLGLALSKGLVEAMGGTIGVHSEPGAGSCFWFELPEAAGAYHSDTEEEEGFEAPLQATGSVLYIEDNLSNLRLIECVMDRTSGLKLHSATQGSIGLEMALSCAPDLILLDLHLPDIPGWEILRRLKDDPQTRDIPVVIISADATAGQIARLREGGAYDYLTKPFDMSRLLRLIDEVFASTSAEPELLPLSPA